MKIVFLALYKVYDFNQIGGTDSYMRRLVDGLISVDNAIEIEWVFYGSPSEKLNSHNPNFLSKYFIKLDDALTYFETTKIYDIVTTYIKSFDRIKFAKFRKKNRLIKFHSLIYFYPETFIKRTIKFSEYKIAPFNGNVYCVSKRQQKYFKKINVNAIYLPPSLPDNYYNNNSSPITGNSKNISITFLGRIDPRKGIQRVVKLFELLSHNKNFALSIYGIYIPGDRVALAFRNYLKNNNNINYIELDRQNYSKKTDELVRKVLAEADIFIQPYKSLESTVDTPLLLLESMASSCAVLTTSIGDVSKIYGVSKFIIEENSFVETAYKLIESLSKESIEIEKKRVYHRIKSFKLGTNSIANKFLNTL